MVKTKLVIEIDEAELSGLLTAEQNEHAVVVEFSFDPFEHTKMIHSASIKAFSMLEELSRNPIPSVEFPKQEAQETKSQESASKSKEERKSKSKSKDTSGKARKSSPMKKPEKVEEVKSEEPVEDWMLPFGTVPTRPRAAKK